MFSVLVQGAVLAVAEGAGVPTAPEVMAVACGGGVLSACWRRVGRRGEPHGPWRIEVASAEARAGAYNR
ncbi:hypothetical protein [Nocardiopsis alba]|uniref:hypothetical protein n=1 Tax=Nocardiopsis alba TaxID=53437 RepID=UPI0035D6942D